MEKLKQKSKKDKSVKNADKDKSNMFISDVKSLKENLKIREILRTVKMNSSMRLKAPRGSKVMQNRDFNDNEELFDETTSNASHDSFESPSALNPVIVLQNSHGDVSERHSSDAASDDNNKAKDKIVNNICDEISTPMNDSFVHNNQIHKASSLADSLNIDIESVKRYQVPSDNPQSPELKSNSQQRHRKLSLDQTMLSRSECLSQSSVDLHSIGKSPLERKSSFFRKKMDNFLKNTTEIFKRQSSQSKSKGISRRGSMSVSLQSLNGKASYSEDISEETVDKHGEIQGSVTSLHSSLTAERSVSSLSVSQSDRLVQDVQFEGDSIGSSPVLVTSQPLIDVSSNSVSSLNEALIQEAMLNRAISMSSGLDSAQGKGRRKASRSNRLTWVASEGITNYFRRLSQGEKNREMQGCHSYQDFSTIPENNLYGSKSECKGRRLSYQRAVSGEDPLPSSRYHDSSLRRKPLIPENSEVDCGLVQLLTDYTRNGVPPLHGLILTPISERSYAYLCWMERAENIAEYYDQKEAGLSKMQEQKQSAIRELVATEADYIRHLNSIVNIFMAAAHALQNNDKLLDVDTEKIFNNIPDILNANLYFWEHAIVPMLGAAVENAVPLQTELMTKGFYRFREIFIPYEKYVCNQHKALEYLKSLSSNVNFAEYLSWCHNSKFSNRLLLTDFLSKPMQRLTKYSLMIRSIINHTESEPERTMLTTMEIMTKNYVIDINRTIRQREELEVMDHLSTIIDTYERDFKDDDLDKCFRSLATVNLKAPMVNCLPGHARTLIYQGDLRYKDSGKEQEVRAFLLTDMLLICKKVSKGPFQYKMVRPKFMVDKLVPFLKPPGTKDLLSLIYVVVDEVRSPYNAFALSDPGKDSSGVTLKTWETKVREAKMTYDLGVYYAKNPSRPFSETSSDYMILMKQFFDDPGMEREVRERVATMLHRCKGASIEHENAIPTGIEGGEAEKASQAEKGMRPPNLHTMRHLQRTSTESNSKDSWLSSAHHSLSVVSYDDPQAGPSWMNQSAESTVVTHMNAVQTEDDGTFAMTPNILNDSKSDSVTSVPSHNITVIPVTPTSQPSPNPQLASSQHSPTAQHAPALHRATTPQPPVVILEQSSPSRTPPSPSATADPTLLVEPQSDIGLVHSLPNLTIDPSLHVMQQSESSILHTASEKLYQSHQELLQRNRIATQQQYLSPDHRGSSYPPSSPPRASLKRSLAFSQSFKYPPLYKMGHVLSQSQLSDTGPSTPSTKTKESQTDGQSSKGEKKSLLGSARTKDKIKSREKQIEIELQKAMLMVSEQMERDDQKTKEMEKGKQIEGEKAERERNMDQLINSEEKKEIQESNHGKNETKEQGKDTKVDDNQDIKVECHHEKKDVKVMEKGKGKGKKTDKNKDITEKSNIEAHDEGDEKVIEEFKDDRQATDAGQKQVASSYIEEDGTSSLSASDSAHVDHSA